MSVPSISHSSAAAALGAILLLAPAAPSQSRAANAPPPRLYRSYGKKASEVYKNIQVLREIDSTELIPTMQYMADSLGVACDFCHVPTGSDKDEKEMKVKARKMISMTREINRTHFDGAKTVSCITCHRGAELPVLYPPVPEEGAGRVAAAPAAANLPAAGQILDRYLEAVGGAAALRKISTRVQKGSFVSGDSRVPYEIYAKGPNRRAAITHEPDGDTFNVFNGTSGWLEITASSPPGRDLTPSETAAAKLDADLQFTADPRRLVPDWRVLPPETIDGRQMYVLSGKPENMRPVRLYFDPRTGLLARVLRYTEVALGFTPVRIDYADYRDVDGVKIPFRWTQSRPSGSSTVRIETVQQNVPIEDSRFGRSPAGQGQ